MWSQTMEGKLDLEVPNVQNLAVKKKPIGDFVPLQQFENDLLVG